MATRPPRVEFGLCASPRGFFTGRSALTENSIPRVRKSPDVTLCDTARQCFGTSEGAEANPRNISQCEALALMMTVCAKRAVAPPKVMANTAKHLNIPHFIILPSKYVGLTCRYGMEKRDLLVFGAYSYLGAPIAETVRVLECARPRLVTVRIPGGCAI